MSTRTLLPAKRAVNLATLLTQSARRFADRDALVRGDVRWTWAELDRRVSSLATELRARGVVPGDCVLVHSPNDLEYVVATFAVWRAGAVLAPTNFRITAADVAGIAGVCRPTLMICHRDLADHAEVVAAEVGLAHGVLWLGADADDADGVTAASTAHPDRFPDAAVLPGDHAWYFFTSGTSGTPKAAILTHDQMGYVVTNHLCDLMPGTTEHDVSLVVAPLSHGAGIHLLPQVARGARTVLTTSPGMDGEEVWGLVEREGVTNMFTVPTILKLLAEHEAVGRHDHGSLRFVIYAGAPMYAADQQHALATLGPVLVQYYGLGEVTGNITVLPPHEHGRPGLPGVDFGTCGAARTAMEISIQAEDGTVLPSGEQGEICVAGPGVFTGYLHHPTANADSFRDGWFRTGDLGILDEQGYLYVTGRSSDMYISGGSNVYPRDIEEKLLQHPDVAEVAVLGMPHPTWGEVGVAVCVPAGDAGIDPAALTGWLDGKLARYKLPRHVVVWDELPRSAYGKIVKRTIKSMLLDQGWAAEERSA